MGDGAAGDATAGVDVCVVNMCHLNPGHEQVSCDGMPCLGIEANDEDPAAASVYNPMTQGWWANLEINPKGGIVPLESPQPCDQCQVSTSK